VTTLILSPRHRADDQLLWRAATRRGWQVERAHGISSLQPIEDEVVIYAEAFFAPLIAQRLGAALVDPPEDWLPQLPYRYRQRDVWRSTLAEARSLTRPTFVKPPNDKSFPARVYSAGDSLPCEFDGAMTVLLAEPVTWKNEYRCFVLDGSVLTLSPYIIDGELAEVTGFVAPDEELAAVRSFAHSVAADFAANVPAAVALDVGFIEGRGWAVVEANGAWGSGIYGCDPDAVLYVLKRATVTRRTVV
jgi:hypothetical protein